MTVWTKHFLRTNAPLVVQMTDAVNRLQGVPQIHFIGGRDDVVTYYWFAHTLLLAGDVGRAACAVLFEWGVDAP